MTMKKCHYCNGAVEDTALVCGTCGQPPEGLPEWEHGRNAILALSTLAWLDLVGGVVIGLYLLMYVGSAPTEVWGVTLGVGVVLLVQGVYGWALLLVIAGIAENLILIRRSLARGKVV